MFRRFALTAILMIAASATAVRVNAAPVTITFDGLGIPVVPGEPVPPDVPFDSYSQSDVLVEPLSDDWFVRTSTGTPPFVFFRGFAYLDPPTPAEVEVTAGGALFTFDAVDLYSSVTRIPWEFTGYLDSAPVFSNAGEHPNTFGTFVTIANASASVPIDRLVIRLTQPMNMSCPSCTGNNPMGLDNIALNTVPEPGMMTLLAIGAACATVRRARRGSRSDLERK